jgi:hypothetical protein
MSARTWTLSLEPPPAPPSPVDVILAREGLVDPLLAALLPAALRGDGAAALAPDGGWWRVVARWEGSRVHVAALDVTAAWAAERAVALARSVSDASTLDEILQRAGPYRVALGGRAVDAAGAWALDPAEAAAAREARKGRVVRADDWAAVPLVVDGEPFAALLGPAADRGAFAELEAVAVVLAAPIARAIGVGSGALRGALQVIAASVVRLQDGSGGPSDVDRIGAVTALHLGRVSPPDEGPYPLVVALRAALAAARQHDPGAEIELASVDGTVDVDRGALELALVQALVSRGPGRRRVEGGVTAEELWVEVSGGEGGVEGRVAAPWGHLTHGPAVTWLRAPRRDRR